MNALRPALPVLLLSLALLLCGCAVPSASPSPQTASPASSSAPTPSSSAATPSQAPTPSAAPTPSPTPALTPVPGLADEIGTQHEAWLASGVTSYTWQLRVSCFCENNGPLTVTVANGMVTAITRPDGPVSQGDLPGFELTVDGLYAHLAEALASGGTVDGVFGDNGVPERVSVNPVKDADDDEYAVEVLTFNPGA